ncbi:alpha/beta fold hydrolase [Nocardia sp. CA-128927]|uniref:alpha/beta fold hydrolase n=1 Tax=Nocardia sp. CA-128927 TaxID=3239975 RepID=UPI003D96B790
MIRNQEHVLTVPTSDGLRLAARRLGRVDAPATIVYLHGILTDSSCWDAVTRHLHDTLDGGIVQIAYDQRGYGHSGRPNRHQSTTLHQLADDLDAVMTHAVGAVVLVTHSVGSLVAQAYAELYPDRAAALSGIVLLNGTAELPCLPSQFVHLSRLRHGRLDFATASAHAMLQRRLTAGTPYSETPAELGDAGCHVDPRVLADVLGAITEFRLEAATAATLRAVPTFVVAAANDQIVPPSQSVRLADAIWGDYDIVPASGHLLPQSDPEAAAAFILRALDIAYRTDADRLRGPGGSDSPSPRVDRP